MDTQTLDSILVQLHATVRGLPEYFAPPQEYMKIGETFAQLRRLLDQGEEELSLAICLFGDEVAREAASCINAGKWQEAKQVVEKVKDLDPKLYEATMSLVTSAKNSDRAKRGWETRRAKAAQKKAAEAEAEEAAKVEMEKRLVQVAQAVEYAHSVVKPPEPAEEPKAIVVAGPRSDEESEGHPPLDKMEPNSWVAEAANTPVPQETGPSVRTQEPYSGA